MMLRSWKFWISLAILLAFIIVVERSYGWLAVLASWQRISTGELTIAVTLMLISYLLRALRFYDFFHPYCHGQWWRLTRITVLHNFFNNRLAQQTSGCCKLACWHCLYWFCRCKIVSARY